MNNKTILSHSSSPLGMTQFVSNFEEDEDEDDTEMIYVKDTVYAWLPAKVLSSSTTTATTTKVEIVLPDNWIETTVLYEDSTIQELEFVATTNCYSSKQQRKYQSIYHYEQNKGTNTKSNKGIERTINVNDYPNGEWLLQNIEKNNSDKLINARDMSDLPFLHEAAILYNLKLRNAKKLPYTRVGDIMVAVNPYQWIDGLYNFEKQVLYAQEFLWNTTTTQTNNTSNSTTKNGSYYSKLGLEPHIFETSSLAYSGMMVHHLNQTILVSGESGAGKTETVKLVMTNLATMEQTRSTAKSKEDYISSPQSIVQHVLESNPVFEAFGNAKTSRNNNSSRFGRFTQLQFDCNTNTSCAKLVGSRCLTYLLEKSRIVHHTSEERTYHIFYQLLAAPEEEKIRIWKDGLSKTSNESFAYVGWSDICAIDGKSDKEAWKETVCALKLFGFTNQTFLDLMRALCVVLQLGNLTFDNVTDEGGCTITNQSELEKLSLLIGIPQEDIMKAMTTRINTIRGEEVVKKLNPTSAKDGCDALSKEIYALIFGILVRKINESTSPPRMNMGEKYNNSSSSFGTISLLDIFGFERFGTNRYEQMCINYANERLQYKYVLDNFVSAQEEYAREGIELFDFSIVDNSNVVTVFEGDSASKQLGLIALLNEECMRPSGTDNAFVSKSKKNLFGSSRLLTHNLHQPYEFAIHHFAGVVTYDANKFLQSNMDHIPDDLINCACNSTNNIISSEFSLLAACRIKEPRRAITKHIPGRKNTISNSTVISKFRSQLDFLVKTIDSTRTRYIRCIKPNSSLLPAITDHLETMNQLASAGLVTAITISRETFPNRLHYKVVWDRFQCLTPLKGNTQSCSSTHKSNLRENVKSLLGSLLLTLFKRVDGLRVPSYACGRTKVYFRAGALESLESDRLEYYSLYATAIQKWYLCHALRLNFISLKCSAILVQAHSRRIIARNVFLAQKLSCIKIQSLWRSVLTRRVLCTWILSAISIQSSWRRMFVRKAFIEYKEAAIQIQKVSKGKIERRKLKERKLIKKKNNITKKKSNEFVRDSRRIDTLSVTTTKDHLGNSDSCNSLRLFDCGVSSHAIHSGKPLQNAPQPMHKFLLEENAAIRQHNISLATEISELEQDKQGLIHHAKAVEARENIARLHTQQLTKTNASLIAGLTSLRQENVELRKDIRQIQDNSDKEIFAASQKFNNALVERETELISLKKAHTRQHEQQTCGNHVNSYNSCKEVTKLNKKIARQREDHLTEINTLKKNLQTSQDTHPEYWEKLTDVLETSHAAREDEVEKIHRLLKRVKEEKDLEIFKLMQEIDYLRNPLSHQREHENYNIRKTTDMQSTYALTDNFDVGRNGGKTGNQINGRKR